MSMGYGLGNESEDCKDSQKSNSRASRTSKVSSYFSSIFSGIGVSLSRIVKSAFTSLDPDNKQAPVLALAEVKGTGIKLHREDWKSVLISSLGNMFEWFDFAIFGFFASEIGAAFFSSSSANSQLLNTFAVFGAAFVFRPVGAVVFGEVSHRS